MTDEQKILLALVKLMFPREMLDYFEVVGFEIHEDSISVRLDERDRILKKKFDLLLRENYVFLRPLIQ